MDTLRTNNVSALLEGLRWALEHTREQRLIVCGGVNRGAAMRPPPEVNEGFRKDVSTMGEYHDLMGRIRTLQHRQLEDDDVWRLLAEVHAWISRSVHMMLTQQAAAGQVSSRGSR